MIEMCFTVGLEKKPQITQIKNVIVQHPHLASHPPPLSPPEGDRRRKHFSPPHVGGVRGGG